MRSLRPATDFDNDGGCDKITGATALLLFGVGVVAKGVVAVEEDVDELDDDDDSIGNVVIDEDLCNGIERSLESVRCVAKNCVEVLMTYKKHK